MGRYSPSRVTNLDFSSVGTLALSDGVLRTLLPDLDPMFASWLRAVQSGRRDEERKVALEFLSQLGPGHLEVISGHLGDEVVVECPDVRLVRETQVCHLDGEHGFDPGWVGVACLWVSRDREGAVVCSTV